MTAQLEDITLMSLGQSDPPSVAASFSGEISHFGLYNQALAGEQVEQLALCKDEYYELVRKGVAGVAWEEGIWHQVYIVVILKKCRGAMRKKIFLFFFFAVEGFLHQNCPFLNFFVCLNRNKCNCVSRPLKKTF